MNDIDAEERGKIRGKPITVHEALNSYRRNLEVRQRVPLRSQRQIELQSHPRVGGSKSLLLDSLGKHMGVAHP
jgi:hypothetical protein